MPNYNKHIIADHGMFIVTRVLSKCDSLKLTTRRYCGGALNCIFNQPQVEIISTVVPFSLGVVFNNEEGDGLLNRGFQLNYRQIVCYDRLSSEPVSGVAGRMSDEGTMETRLGWRK